MATSSRNNPRSVVRSKAAATPRTTAPLPSGAMTPMPASSKPPPSGNTASTGTTSATQQGTTPDNAMAASTAIAHLAEPSMRATALSNMQQVVELADGIVHIADQLHERLLEDILRYDGRPMPAAQQATTRQLLDDELLLRQHAQSLYADAAAFVIQGLAQPQSRLMALTTVAAEKIRRIGVISEVTGLVGGILALAGGIVTGQLSQVEAAFEKIRLHNTTLDALKPPPPANT
jgi:hypothetical protein